MEFKLKPKQIEELQRLYNHKKSFLIQSFIGFVVLVLLSFFPLFSFFTVEFTYGNWLQRHKVQIISLIAFTIIVYKVVDYFFLKTLVPISKDLKQKIGIIEKHQIIRKQFFPLTNDHFFFFAEREIPNIPVDALTYQHYQVGDYFTIHKAKHSNIVFEDIDRQEINTEHVFEDTGQYDIMDSF